MKLSTWVQFTWNLEALPKEVPPIDARYTVEAASPEDRRFFPPPSAARSPWSRRGATTSAGRVKLAEELIDVAFPAGEVVFVAVKHGARIIAASAIRDSGDQVSNLPVGVCVLNEYRCRGLGHLSLI